MHTTLQSLLTELSEVGKRHGVSIADVACRWVLDRPQVRAFAPLGRRFPTGLFLLCQAAGCWIGHRSVPATVHDNYAIINPLLPLTSSPPHSQVAGVVIGDRLRFHLPRPMETLRHHLSRSLWPPSIHTHRWRA